MLHDEPEEFICQLFLTYIFPISHQSSFFLISVEQFEIQISQQMNYQFPSIYILRCNFPFYHPQKIIDPKNIRFRLRIPIMVIKETIMEYSLSTARNMNNYTHSWHMTKKILQEQLISHYWKTLETSVSTRLPIRIPSLICWTFTVNVWEFNSLSPSETFDTEKATFPYVFWRNVLAKTGWQNLS